MPLTPGQSINNKSRILPPVSSMASPAAQESAMHYPWSSSLTGSLRAGPLSPAMLAGPQGSFENFRTGFTPDLSNFKTGLTPLGGVGGSFPPPSPNTAAFLAMMNNSHAPGLSGPTITPGTLSALTGNPMDAHASNGSILASHPDDSKDYGYFGRGVHDTPGKTGHSRMTIGGQGQGGDRSSEQHSQAGPSGSAQREGGPGGTKQAASGLFLLSQAHQELSKREETAAAAQAAAHALHGVGGGNMHAQSLYSDAEPSSGKGGKAQSSSSSNKGSGAGAGKRKKANSDAAGTRPASKGGSSKKSKATPFDMGSPDYESDELGDEGPTRGMSFGKASSTAGSEGGTEEEKRRNFLERNRQAALKCRQRKKAWLSSLQAKVEYLQSDNEGLQGTVGALRNEVMFLKSQLMQAQRQLAANGIGPPPPHGIEGAPQGPPAMGGHRGNGGGPPAMGGPMDMGHGMGMPNGMPMQPMAHPHGNMHPMAGGGPNGGPFPPHAGPRSGNAGPFAGNSGKPQHNAPHARQGSLQAV